ncbi:programmed cell death protein 2 [Boeremia exigua]|uniref:programmed cell death protein 2 n=1 Tax=Boeremia exigua TaxID=749465 RepID=UPI001E8EC749|nr:programmed cell death protein 2 [Boeremia exigua]KAH6637460.1 programmed cell death protein 2 [Boeremia exigua]
MPPYESESSDEGEDYTETNVLLGYATKDATGDAISHIGGAPSWIDDKTAPSGALAKCKVCNGLLSLLLELNGDLPDHFPGHERRLYIWSCRRKACRRKEGSVRGIRGVRVAKGASAKSHAKPEKKEIIQEEKPQPKIGESLFGVKTSANSTAPANPFSNPFSANTGSAPANPFASSAGANPFGAAPAAAPAIEVTPEEKKDEASTTLPETFAQKARISGAPFPQPALPQEPWPAESAFPAPFPYYSLDAEYETLDTAAPAVPQNVRMLDLDSEAGPSSGKEDKEIYESAHDATFQRFADRVGQNPEQILRYEFQGRPLLYSDADAVGKALAHSAEGAAAKVQAGRGMPRCANCGAERVFEVQLTPHAITELEAEEMGVDGMEWGTVVLGVCSRDCAPSGVEEGGVGYVEEWAGVQWEEVAKK